MTVVSQRVQKIDTVVRPQIGASAGTHPVQGACRETRTQGFRTRRHGGLSRAVQSEQCQDLRQETDRNAPGRFQSDGNAAGHPAAGDNSAKAGAEGEGAASQRYDSARESANRENALCQTADGDQPGGAVADGQNRSGMAPGGSRGRIRSQGDLVQRPASDSALRLPTNGRAS